MKSILSKISLGMFILINCVGCSNSISQKEYDNLLIENAQLKEQLDQIKSESIHAKVTGSFSATLRYLIPDYCEDSTTPTVAVVTCYQDGPFVFYIGEEWAKRLIIGETYYFELEDENIGELTESQFNNGWADPAVVIPRYNLRIKNIRKAEENELGVESVNVHFEKINQFTQVVDDATATKYYKDTGSMKEIVSNLTVISENVLSDILIDYVAKTDDIGMLFNVKDYVAQEAIDTVMVDYIERTNDIGIIFSVVDDLSQQAIDKIAKNYCEQHSDLGMKETLKPYVSKGVLE